MVTDRGETPTTPHTVGIAARRLGRFLHRAHTAHEGLVREERVQHHVIEGTARERERVRAERHDRDRDVLVEVGIESEERIAAGGSVVTEDRLAAPEPAHEPDEVLHLSRRDRGKAERVPSSGRFRDRARA